MAGEDQEFIGAKIGALGAPSRIFVPARARLHAEPARRPNVARPYPK